MFSVTEYCIKSYRNLRSNFGDNEIILRNFKLYVLLSYGRKVQHSFKIETIQLSVAKTSLVSHSFWGLLPSSLSKRDHDEGNKTDVAVLLPSLKPNFHNTRAKQNVIVNIPKFKNTFVQMNCEYLPTELYNSLSTAIKINKKRNMQVFSKAKS